MLFLPRLTGIFIFPSFQVFLEPLIEIQQMGHLQYVDAGNIFCNLQNLCEVGLQSDLQGINQPHRLVGYSSFSHSFKFVDYILYYFVNIFFFIGEVL